MQTTMYKKLNELVEKITIFVTNLALKTHRYELQLAYRYVKKLDDENTKLKHQINHNQLEMYAIKKKYENKINKGVEQC